MGKGVEFALKNGELDSYDPIDERQILNDETEYNYWIEVGGYQYSVLKEDILSVRYYDTCEICGYELPNHCSCTKDS